MESMFREASTEHFGLFFECWDTPETGKSWSKRLSSGTIESD